MWEDRKYVVPHLSSPSSGIGGSRSGHHGSDQMDRDLKGTSSYGHSYDPTEDLHAWSIYRQNLNADLSESAIGLNKSSAMATTVTTSAIGGRNSSSHHTSSNNHHRDSRSPGTTNHEPGTKPYGNFQLKESTVNNILSHPKYGPSIKSHDPYTYLRFGLPRVKPMAQSELGGRNYHTNNGHGGPGHRGLGSAGLTSDSASVSGDESPIMKRRSQQHGQLRNQHPQANPSNAKRIWKSNPDLARAMMTSDLIAESNFSSNKFNSHMVNGGPGGDGRRPNSRGYRANGGGPNSKAISEVDLRSTGIANGGYNHANGNSVANGHGSMLNGTGSKGATMNGHTVINGIGGGPGSIIGSNSLHPHLIVRNLYYELDKTSKFRIFCGAQRQKLRILDDISFEVKSGEIMAIMATNASEGTAILDVLANRFNKRKGKVRGDFILNGVYMTPSKLSELISYVNQETDLCPEMTARQTLLFTSLLQKAAKRNDFDPKKRTYSLLEELGLSEVRHSSVSSLTLPEKRRLLIAVALLLDTDILLLDQPVAGMDIFDTFFLIEYLRQWAMVNDRCIIMTLHPATYEIFSMVSRVALVSTGRILYTGKRKDLLSYFAYIDYPCPSFKNPSDYYLDLVTLDNLSAEAVIESGQRIENLVEIFHRRHGHNAVSLPGQASATPPPPKKSGIAIQFLALWIRALIFTFPYNVIHLFRTIFVSLLLSIVLGVIYWHVRVGREQEHLWDRIAFYHSLLAIVPLPLLLITINDAHNEKQYVLNEISQGFYSKFAFFIAKLLYSLPSATLSFVAFALPACSMAGLHNDLSLYLILMLAYLHALRSIALACTWICNTKLTSSSLFGLIYSILILTSGTTFHYKDLSKVSRWMYPLSPMKYTHEALIGWEFSSNVTLALATSTWIATSLPYLCSHNPVIQSENAILIKADCGFQSRNNILSWFSYKGSGLPIVTSNGNSLTTTPAPLDVSLRPFSHSFIVTAIYFAIFSIASLIGFLIFSKRKVNVIKMTNSLAESHKIS